MRHAFPFSLTMQRRRGPYGARDDSLVFVPPFERYMYVFIVNLFAGTITSYGYRRQGRLLLTPPPAQVRSLEDVTLFETRVRQVAGDDYFRIQSFCIEAAMILEGGGVLRATLLTRLQGA